jgi:hypothetical protein
MPDPDAISPTATCFSTAHDLKSAVGLDRRLGAANLTTKGQTVEREAVVLVLQSKAATRLREDLDVAGCCASLRGCCETRCDGAAEWLEHRWC